jgi:hypothetical protein
VNVARAGAAASVTVIDEEAARELAEREKQLMIREQEMAARERELAEQRRVLAEQYRILRSKPAPASADAGGGAAAWPPPAGRAAVQPAAFTVVRPARRSSLWRRVKQTVLGTIDRALEDTL